MSKVKARLQGTEWKALKDKLVMIKYFRNANGHIKGIYKDPSTKSIYTHWLNDNEIIELNKYIVRIGQTKSFVDANNEIITFSLE